MIRTFLQTAFAGAAALGITGGLSPVVSALSLRDPKRANGVIHLWGKSMLASAGVRHEASGLENIPERTCIFVCNHQSHYDSLVIFAHIRKHLRYVAKRELFRIPVFGSALRLAGNISVDRTGSQADKDRMQEAISAVQERVSVMFYPEGTRSEDGALRPFKKGAAMLALQSGVPVVPMAISGTRLILPKGGLAVRWGQRVSLVVGKPLTTDGLTLEDRDALTRRFESEVANLYAEARERSGDRE